MKIKNYTSGSPKKGTSLKDEMKIVKQSARKERIRPNYLGHIEDIKVWNHQDKKKGDLIVYSKGKGKKLRLYFPLKKK